MADREHLAYWGAMLLKLRIATLFAPLIVAACSDRARPDPAICEPLAMPNNPTSETCIHRNAYLLASAPGEANVISKTVVNQCLAAIDQDAAINLGFRAAKFQDAGPADLPEAISNARLKAIDRANFRIIQARAGRCRAFDK